MQQAAASQTTANRTEMRPVKYHYADSFWCTYIISVVSASAAELGKNVQSLTFSPQWNPCKTETFISLNSYLPTWPDKNTITNSRWKCGKHKCKGKRHTTAFALILVLCFFFLIHLPYILICKYVKSYLLSWKCCMAASHNAFVMIVVNSDTSFYIYTVHFK